MPAGSAAQANSASGGNLSTKFAGICVTFGNVKAPVFAVAATQITVEVPAVTPGQVPVQVLRNCEEASELKSNVLTVSAAPASPEFLYLSTAVDGKNPVAALTAEGEFVGAPGSISGANLRPAKAGDILVAFALGLGSDRPGAGGRCAGSGYWFGHSSREHHDRRRVADCARHPLRRCQPVVHRPLPGQPASTRRRPVRKPTPGDPDRRESQPNRGISDHPVGWLGESLLDYMAAGYATSRPPVHPRVLEQAYRQLGAANHSNARSMWGAERVCLRKRSPDLRKAASGWNRRRPC